MYSAILFGILLSAICFSTSQAAGGLELALDLESPKQNEHKFVLKTLHPVVSYFDHLMVFGLWGSAFRYLLEDDRAFGPHFAYIDNEIKKLHGEKNYRKIVVELLADYRMLFSLMGKLPNILSRIKQVKSKTTGKTFGEALEAILNIQNDREASAEFTDRWNDYERTAEPDDNVHLTAPSELNKKLLDHPEKLSELMSDPAVFQSVSTKVINVLKKVNFDSGLNSVKRLLHLLNALFPESFKKKLEAAFSIQDPKTKRSLGESLETVFNILNDPDGSSKIVQMLKSQQQKILADPDKHMSVIKDAMKLGLQLTGIEKIGETPAADDKESFIKELGTEGEFLKKGFYENASLQKVVAPKSPKLERKKSSTNDSFNSSSLLSAAESASLQKTAETRKIDDIAQNVLNSLDVEPRYKRMNSMKRKSPRRIDNSDTAGIASL